MPQNIDLLLEPRWIAPVAPNTVLEHHAVAVQQGRIADILPATEAWERYSPQEHRKLDEHLLIPGLVNLHTHAAMSLMRGLADDLPLMEWLQQHIWPTEAAHVSYDMVHDGTLLACAEMLGGGITCFNDMYFFPQAAAEASLAAGMRAALGITVLEFPNNYASDADDYLQKGLAVREQYSSSPLLNFCLAPHAPYTVNDNTFLRVLTLSEQLELPIHIHLHETRDELNGSLSAHGCRPLQRLNNLGLLSPKLLGVHGVHLDHEEIAQLSDHGCSMAHCPSSNLKLGSGIAPLSQFLSAGLNVGLGSDGAASNNRLDILSEMRLAALLAKGASGDPTVANAKTILKMATLNGAKALGMEQQIGSIEKGKWADLCAIDLGAPECQPVYDPISHLVFVAGRENVSHVWVQGKIQVDDKKLTNPKLKNLKNPAGLWQNKICLRPTP